jgi:hypothetical protein
MSAKTAGAIIPVESLLAPTPKKTRIAYHPTESMFLKKSAISGLPDDSQSGFM